MAVSNSTHIVSYDAYTLFMTLKELALGKFQWPKLQLYHDSDN